ncbi:hypothetical protein AB685_09690 [Bacillus sp. LL01]|uniref:hypothetical protein n=1 Tax=Bacillus sp. LL01 TaxID=1665556 RepID=UPI00064D5B92|nr:hypothetical protein [Bacillus sp. LL01]KMJ58179.1 hypothetical protein AB685_09690 [Bacillus sp. LL01]
MDQQGELFLTKQQVIYYRAEVAKYKEKIRELERLVDKEIIRNKYLQAKIRELNSDKIARYVEEIHQLRKKVLELEVELEEERNIQESLVHISEIAVEQKKEEKIDFYSYFNYSIILPTEGEDTVSIYGDFTIMNSEEVPLENFVVCFKVKPVGGVITLSGKVSDPMLLQGPGKNREDIEWIYAVNDWRKRIIKEGKYWVQPVHSPKENRLTFKTFEISINKQSYSGNVSMEAFTYFETNPTPLTSLNKIKLQIP